MKLKVYTMNIVLTSCVLDSDYYTFYRFDFLWMNELTPRRENHLLSITNQFISFAWLVSHRIHRLGLSVYEQYMETMMNLLFSRSVGACANESIQSTATSVNEHILMKSFVYECIKRVNIYTYLVGMYVWILRELISQSNVCIKCMASWLYACVSVYLCEEISSEQLTELILHNTLHFFLNNNKNSNLNRLSIHFYVSNFLILIYLTQKRGFIISYKRTMVTLLYKYFIYNGIWK